MLQKNKTCDVVSICSAIYRENIEISRYTRRRCFDFAENVKVSITKVGR